MKNLIERASTCCLSVSFVFLMASPAGAQNCGWSRIDHEIGYSESGIWKPSVYRNLMNTLTIAQVGGALWEGSDSRLGLTMWKGIDSQLIGAAGAEAGKRIFRRERPATANNPCVWFHDSNHSFPAPKRRTRPRWSRLTFSNTARTNLPYTAFSRFLPMSGWRA